MPYPLDKPLEEYSDEELNEMLSRIRGSRLAAKMTSPARKEKRKKQQTAANKAKKLLEGLDPAQAAALLEKLSGGDS